MAGTKDLKLTNIPVMTVDRVVRQLSEAYCAVIGNGAGVKTIPSVMLWGPPGVGKSQAVRQIAGCIEQETGKKTHVTDVRLLLFNPIDLRGIPTSNKDKTLAVWLKPQIFQMDDSDDVVNILFLDEISAAPQSVQAAAYQITLDRVVGEHRLPDNCIVIAAGNRTIDKSVAYKMPKALANRLMHIEVTPNVNSWAEWANTHQIYPGVISYLTNNERALNNLDAESEELAFATPRSWEMVSNILTYVNPDIDEVFDLVAGVIGSGAAAELREWLISHDQIPDIESIFDGKATMVPKNTDALYTLVQSMIAYASEHMYELDRIGNSIVYAGRMPPDYSVMLMRAYLGFEEGYDVTLMRIPEFARWMQTKGVLLNGDI